jgi:ligand-binding sensor domain-containing protein
VIPKKTLFMRAVVSLVVLIAAGVLFSFWRATRILKESKERFSAEQNLAFEVRAFPPIASRFEWIAAPTEYTSAAVLGDNLYLGGTTGIDEFDSRGALLKSYRVGRELPPSPIVQLAIGTLTGSKQPELIIATAREGLLAFDGQTFRLMRPQSEAARRVASILPLSTGELLVGTETLGVLRFNGVSAAIFHPSLKDIHVTALAGGVSDLWVGTLDRGVLHYSGGHTDEFSDAKILADARVHSLLIDGDHVYAGTAAGVTEFVQGRFARMLAPGVFAKALAVDHKALQIGTIDQGVLEVALDKSRAAAVKPLGAELPEVQGFVRSEAGLYALTRDGLHDRDRGWQRVLTHPAGPLTDANISALHVDDLGRVWVGYFDRGLDVLPPNGKPTHVEDDHVFCVNRIIAHPQGVAVATANGLALFDANGTLQQVLTKKDGLIADHVTDVALTADRGMVLATGAGLTIMDASGPRSLYAFHGLVNNHVYSLGVSADGRTTMVGTLGGISILAGDQVRANLTTATSSLQHNWITALVPVGRDWLVGTYGAGIVKLDEFGRFTRFDVASGDFEINPNALLVTPDHVFAGTLDRGLLVYSRRREQWVEVNDGLPSRNVTAFAVGNGFVYVGTDNGLVRVREGDLD